MILIHTWFLLIMVGSLERACQDFLRCTIADFVILRRHSASALSNSLALRILCDHWRYVTDIKRWYGRLLDLSTVSGTLLHLFELDLAISSS